MKNVINILEYIPPYGRKQITALKCGDEHYEAWQDLCTRGYELSCEYRANIGKWIFWALPPGATEEEEFMDICDSVPFAILSYWRKHHG